MFNLKSVALIVFPVLSLFFFIRNEEDPMDKIIASLGRWSKSVPQEKMYLHTDKPYYAAGDTIWFKAYITIGSRHQLSALSGAMYADLINEKDSIEKTLKLPLTAGMAMGDFILDSALNEGNYRIRAYTRWMRNAGEEYFFDRTFSVGSTHSQDVSARAEYRHKTIDGKPAVTALLNYTDQAGKPFAGKEVKYEIKSGQNIIGSEKARTDADGNVGIDIPNDKGSNLKGAYLQASIQTGNKVVSKIFPIKAALSHSDVQIFPESGNLVNGISSRVAFKAVGIDGIGVKIKGVVTDEQNQEVTSFESMHAGMGTFSLKPEAGKTYKASITYEDGSETTVPLPKAEEEGYVLAVYQTGNDSLLIRINASPKYYEIPQTVNVVAQTGGELIDAFQVKVGRPVTSVWIPGKDFPTGIAQFTMFNSAGEPLNERIAFIRNSDQMRVELNAVKQSYKLREKTEIGLESKDQYGKPVAGSFSVVVLDESKVPADETAESTILSSILLTSDLKGYIEKPNYYFTKETPEINKALDNLMLTQGYRRFIWKALLKEQPVVSEFTAEKTTTEITGKMLTLGGKPVPDGKVTLFSLKAGIMKDTPTDAAGRFSFNNLVLADSMKFTVQGRTQKNGKNVEVILDQIPEQQLTRKRNPGDINTHISDTIKSYLANRKKQDEVLEKQGKLNGLQQLKEVVIKAPKAPVEEVYNLNGPGRYDQIIKTEELQTCPNLLACLQGRLAGVVFRTVNKPNMGPVTYAFSTSGEAMLVVLDGFQINPQDNSDAFKISGIFDQNDPPPSEIASIEVLKTPGLTAVYGEKGRNGVILINTKHGISGSSRYNPSVVNVSPKGFNQVREFYSPRYDHPKTNTDLPDLRSTIYWNPDIRTAADGKATFGFFNADDAGNYKVIVEGINTAGELGRQVYRYHVEE